MSEQQEQDGPRHPGRSRRSRAPGGRPHTIRVTLSDAEYLPIHAAAVRAGISDASWLGQIGARVAAQPGATSPPREWGEAMQTLMTVRAELMEDRRVLRNVGGNLNDLARLANTHGGAPAADRDGPTAPGDPLAEPTARVLALVEHVVERIAETVDALDEQVAVARAARLAGAD